MSFADDIDDVFLSLHLRETIYTLTENKVSEFSEWAFGPNYNEESELLENWNELHGHIFKFYEYENPHVVISKMIEIWRENS